MSWCLYVWEETKTYLAAIGPHICWPHPCRVMTKKYVRNSSNYRIFLTIECTSILAAPALYTKKKKPFKSHWSTNAHTFGNLLSFIVIWIAYCCVKSSLFSMQTHSCFADQHQPTWKLLPTTPIKGHGTWNWLLHLAFSCQLYIVSRKQRLGVENWQLQQELTAKTQASALARTLAWQPLHL